MQENRREDTDFAITSWSASEYGEGNLQEGAWAGEGVKCCLLSDISSCGEACRLGRSLVTHFRKESCLCGAYGRRKQWIELQASVRVIIPWFASIFEICLSGLKEV